MEKILSDLKAMRLPGMAQTWQNLMEAHKSTQSQWLTGCAC